MSENMSRLLVTCAALSQQVNGECGDFQANAIFCDLAVTKFTSMAS